MEYASNADVHTNYERVLKNDKSLTLLIGTQSLINSLLTLEMLSEHLDDEKNARTIYIDEQSSYFEAKAKLLRAFKNKDCVCIFENINNPKYSRLILSLLDCHITIWAGINAPNIRIAKLAFKTMLASTIKSTDSDKVHNWIFNTYNKLLTAEKRWNIIDLCDYEHTISSINTGNKFTSKETIASNASFYYS